jgi:hypothetical protein
MNFTLDEGDIQGDMVALSPEDLGPDDHSSASLK